MNLTLKKYSIPLISLILLGILTLQATPRPGSGISSWGKWNPDEVTKAESPELRTVPFVLGWNKVEPEEGEFAFDGDIGDRLRAAHKEDLYIFLMIWVRPGTPEWLFEDKGVPRVYTDREVNPLGRKMTKEDNLHPYYMDPNYKKYFFRMIKEFGKYVNGLPKELRERIVFVQSAEGSTGDGQPYKGDPLESKYDISEKDWNVFRRATWVAYQKALPGIPILVNSDANTPEENDWMFENMDVISLKHGMFSHGYHVSDNTRRLANFDAITARAKKQGLPVLTRGEMDGEMFVYEWSTRNIPQAVYWSGLFASHCRLDIWNIPTKAVVDPANIRAFKFFNRYAGWDYPEDSPRAFIALRDGLNAADFERFPASRYGGKEGNKRELSRYMNIAKDYAKYGARMDDPEKVMGGGMINRKRMGYNDVGWGILPGNYSRFITQVDPGSGDIGLWHVDKSLYGRFARSFEHASGKKQMRFQLDKAFTAEKVQISVTYLDRGTGKWSLGVAEKAFKQVSNKGSGKWKSLKVTVPRKTLKNAELLLNYEGGDDTIFHMIQIERI
ncbi:MAG: hypothetical protein AB3N63_19295 [Puniceicoccaceae bacterium]